MDRKLLKTALEIANRYPIASNQIEFKEEKDKIEAEINTENWHARIILPYKAKVKFIDNGISFNRLPTILEFLVRHEFGHWKYCPSSRNGLDAIAQGIKDAANEMGRKISERQLNYLANMFEDFVDNIANVFISVGDVSKEYVKGFSSFYLYDLKTSIGKNLGIEYLYPEMQVFLEVQSMFFDAFNDDEFERFFDSVRLKNSMSDVSESDLEEAVKRVSEILTGKSPDQFTKLSQNEKEAIARNLIEPSGWYEKSKEIAKVLLKFMSKSEDYLPYMFLFDKINHSNGDVIPIDIPFDKSKETGSKPGDSFFLYSKDSKGAAASRNNFRSLMPPKDLFNMLDSIYSNISKNIHLDLKIDEHSSYFSKKIGDQFDKEINPAYLKWVARVGPRELLVDAFRKYNLAPGGIVDKSLPNILFIIDSSSSMGWGILDLINKAEKGERVFYADVEKATLNNNSYDLMIRAVYSVIEYLKKEEILGNVNLGLINFSDSTAWSGWKKEKDLNDIKELLFSCQNGGTELIPDPLKRVYRDAEKRGTQVITLLISDGEIENSETVVDSFAKYWRSHPFIFLQLRFESKFARQLKEAGVPVVIVENAKDLSRMVLKFTKSQMEKAKRERVG